MSLNLYTYTANNPLIYIDPSGHKYCAGSFKEFGGCAAIGMTFFAWYIHNQDKQQKAIANFLIVDDINTLLDPNASNFDKSLAASGFLPVGKLIKGGKLIIKLANGEKEIERAVDATDDAFKAAKAVNYTGAFVQKSTNMAENMGNLRIWAKDMGWEQQFTKGGVEMWGVKNGDSFSWRLKMKPESSTREGLGAGSNKPRFDARLDDKGTYVNPYTGEIGGKNIGTHLDLE